MTIEMLAGVHDVLKPADVAKAYPGATVGREFIYAKDLPSARDVRPDFDRIAAPWLALTDGVVYVSLKPKPTEVANGAWSAPLRQLGTWLAEHGDRVRVIVHHEPEDDMSGQAFASLFNRSRELIKAAHAGATIAYAAMSYQWSPGKLAAVSPAGWQTVKADEYLCDVYSGKTFPATASLPEHPGFIPWYNAIVKPKLAMSATRVRWGLGERGWDNSTARPDTIRRDAAWLRGLLDGERAGTLPAGSAPSTFIGWATEDPGDAAAGASWLLDAPGKAALAELVKTVTYVPEPADPYADFAEIGAVGPTGSKTTLFGHGPTGTVVFDRDAFLTYDS